MMDAEWIRRYPVIVSALSNGAEIDQIPSLLGIPRRIWAEIQEDEAFITLRDGEQLAPVGPMTSEEVLSRATSMTSEAFETLEAIINDSRATATARLQAATTIFNWREELQRKKSEADARLVYHLHIDGRAVTRMQQMVDQFLSPEGKKWLRDMTAIMPNSTA